MKKFMFQLASTYQYTLEETEKIRVCDIPLKVKFVISKFNKNHDLIYYNNLTSTLEGGIFTLLYTDPFNNNLLKFSYSRQKTLKEISRELLKLQDFSNDSDYYTVTVKVDTKEIVYVYYKSE